MVEDKELKTRKTTSKKVDLNTYGYKSADDTESWITKGIAKQYRKNFGLRLLIKKAVHLALTILLLINFIVLCLDNEFELLGFVISIPIIIEIISLIKHSMKYINIRNREYNLIEVPIKNVSIDATAPDSETAYFFETEIDKIRMLNGEELFKVVYGKAKKSAKNKYCTVICIGKKPYLAYLSTNELFGEAPDKYGNTQEELEMAYGNKVTVIEVPETETLDIKENQTHQNDSIRSNNNEHI